jgi:hypothetical protein
MLLLNANAIVARLPIAWKDLSTLVPSNEYSFLVTTLKLAKHLQLKNHELVELQFLIFYHIKLIKLKSSTLQVCQHYL